MNFDELVRTIRTAWGQRMTAGEHLRALALGWEAQGVRERGGDNRGPDVDWFVHDGGGRASAAPPWCAYFVSSLCRQVERQGLPIQYTRTGRAVSHWIKADAVQLIDRDQVWSEPAAGLVFVRTRLSKSTAEVLKVRRGVSRQGHTGVVVDIDPEARTITAIAGNSSGWGHSTTKAGGKVAREVITEGDRAWERLVGFVRVAQP